MGFSLHICETQSPTLSLKEDGCVIRKQSDNHTNGSERIFCWGQAAMMCLRTYRSQKDWTWWCGKVESRHYTPAIALILHFARSGLHAGNFCTAGSREQANNAFSQSHPPFFFSRYPAEMMSTSMKCPLKFGIQIWTIMKNIDACFP